MSLLTECHVAISLLAIAAGVLVVAAMISCRRLSRWTAFFLLTTVATSVTGFFFPVAHLLPSHIVGLVSLVVLAVAIYALYSRKLAGAWRQVYISSAVLALYLNIFVLIVQAFLHVPAFHALAPTQKEPPFAIAQAAALALFVAIGISALVRFRGVPQLAAPAVPAA